MTHNDWVALWGIIVGIITMALVLYLLLRYLARKYPIPVMKVEESPAAELELGHVKPSPDYRSKLIDCYEESIKSREGIIIK